MQSVAPIVAFTMTAIALDAPERLACAVSTLKCASSAERRSFLAAAVAQLWNATVAVFAISNVSSSA